MSFQITKSKNHVSFEYRLKICRHCGELYYKLIENFIGLVDGKLRQKSVYDHTQNRGGDPFLNHLETHD